MRIISTLVFLLLTLTAFSQNYSEIIILDSLTNYPVQNAKITEIGTHKIYYSGYDGSIKVPQKYFAVFRIEHINYNTKTLKLNLKESDIKIYLSKKPYQIEQVVVSSKIPLENTNATNQVISSEQINKFKNINSTIDYFKYNSNITVISPLGIFNHSPLVSLAGMGEEPGRALILLDGIPLNKSDDGNVNWNMLPEGMIDKIILSQNPNSCFFTNNSMIGVINIVPYQKKEAGFSMRSKLNYGTYNTASLELMPSYRHKGDRGLFYDFDLLGRRSDGYISTVDSLRLENVNYLPTKLREYKANLILGYDINSHHTIKIMANAFDDFRGMEVQIKEPQGTYAKHTAYLGSINYNAKFRKTNFGINASYYYESYFKNIESIKKGNYSLIYVNSIRADFNSSLFVNQQIGKFYFISSGINFHSGGVNGVDEYQTSTDRVINSGQLINKEFYLNNTFKFLKDRNLILNFGGNINFTDVLNPQFIIEQATSATDFMLDYTGKFASNKLKNNSFGANLTYNIHDKIALWAGLNKGFYNPPLEDLTRSGFMRLGFKLANPQLLPESTMKYYTGASFNKNNFSMKINASYLDGNNYLAYVETGQTLFGGRKKVVQKRNITDVDMINSSVLLNYNYRKLGCFFNYSFNHSIVNSTDSVYDKKQLAYTPQHSAHLGFNVKIQNIELGLIGNYSSMQYMNIENTQKIEPFATFDAKLKVKLTEALRMSLSVDNFLDYRYLIYYDQESLGRFITFSVNYNF